MPLRELAPDLWMAEELLRYFVEMGRRMTVVCLADGRLWLHSPLPRTDELSAALAALGEVGYVVAASKVHGHLSLSLAEAYAEGDTWRAVQENVEIVRQMLERWNAGDIAGWLQCWDTEAEWVSEPIRAVEGGASTYRGHAGLRRFTVEVMEGFADLGRIERPSFREAGDSVVVLAEYRATARASGAEVASPWGWLFEVRDGKIARGRDFLDQRHALEAAGLWE